jgi:hypothetical protein
MVAVMATYVRSDFDTGGFKYRYWISPSPFKGAILHPAFDLSPSGSFLYGKYLSGGPNTASNTNALRSQAGLYTRALISNSLTGYVIGLNTEADSDHKGWALQSVYEKALITLLMLVEWKTVDFASKLPSLVPSTFNPSDHQSYSQYRGIYLPFFNAAVSWSTSNISATGEKLSGVGLGAATTSTLSIYDPSLSGSLSIGKPANTSNPLFITEWVTGNHPDIGDLQLLFIPKANAAVKDKLGIIVPAVGSSSSDSVSMAYSSQAKGNFPMTWVASQTSDWNFGRLVKRA